MSPNCVEKALIQKNILRFKRILHPTRVRLLCILTEKETCACELVRSLGLANNLVSHHLRVLSKLDLITSRKEGLHIKYSLRDEKRDSIVRLLACIQAYLEGSL